MSKRRDDRNRKFNMEYDNEHRNNDRTNNASNNRDGSNTNFDEDIYATATSYFITSAIEAGRKGYQSTADCIEFIRVNVNEQLFWLRVWRYCFLLEKLVIIIKIIYEMIL